MLQILPIGVQMLAGAMVVLAEIGLRCVAIDLLGYGLSDRRADSWLVGDFADNIEAALGELGIAPDYVLGGHFAGMVAAEIAIRQSSRVKKLVLDGTPLWPEAYRQNLRAEMGLTPVDMTEDGAYLQYFWNMASGMLRKLSPETSISPETAPLIHGVVQGFLKTAFQPDVIPAMVAHDMAARLGAITMPSLIITADNDSQVQYFEQHLALNPHAIGHKFSGTHPLHDMARPARARDYAALVHGFLAEPSIA
jgi:pimeloyl-ACP methyl ester carboxylesterase